MAYPTSELCPFCGAKQPELDFAARLERFNAHVIPKLTVATAGDKHGALAPVDWKARHADIKAGGGDGRSR
jgi:hypothetical protein